MRNSQCRFVRRNFTSSMKSVSSSTMRILGTMLARIASLAPTTMTGRLKRRDEMETVFADEHRRKFIATFVVEKNFARTTFHRLNERACLTGQRLSQSRKRIILYRLRLIHLLL